MIIGGRHVPPSIGLRTMLRLRAGGISLTSQALQRIPGINVRPRFAGAKLAAPDLLTSWGIVLEIASGEYDHPGLTPRQGDRVIDVGANVGVFSLWAQAHGATVVAYEPSPSAFAFLVSNTTGRSIDPIRGAVVGELPLGRRDTRLYLHDEHSTRNTLLAIEIVSGEELTQSVVVPAYRLSDVLVDGCELLKIDTEGSEYEMLANTPADILRQAERIVVEFHRVAGDPEALLRVLRAAGFQAWGLAGETGPAGIIGAIRC
jgi:FkbM family methyltransferase